MRKTFVILIALFMSIVCTGSIQAMEFDVLGGVDIHGFISHGFLQTDRNNFFGETENGTFQFNETGLNFSTDLSDRMHVGVQFLARDFGEIGNNEVTVDWAFADYHWRDYLGFLGGRLKTSQGLYNETRDVDLLRTPVFLPQAIYNESWREMVGAEEAMGIYGEIPVGFAGSLSYMGQYGVPSMPNDGGNARVLQDQFPFDVKVSSTKVKHMSDGMMQWYTPLDGLRLGVSGWDVTFTSTLDWYMRSDEYADIMNQVADKYIAGGNQYIQAGLTEQGQALLAQGQGLQQAMQVYSAVTTPGMIERLDDISVDVDATAYLLSGEYTWGNLVLAAEFARIHFVIDSQNDFLDQLIAADPDSKNPQDFRSRAWYLSAAYRVNDWLELGTYYSEYYPHDDDEDGDRFNIVTRDPNTGEVVSRTKSGQEIRAWLKDTCFTTRFDINENWIIKLEGHGMNGAAQLLLTDNNGGSTLKKTWFLGAVKVTYSF